MALPITKSYEKVNYLLRPSKQVERRLIVECCQLLGQAGLPIKQYTYVGLGSVFFVDFVLFHKYLLIDKMICSEWGDIHKRMRFNRPYKFIQQRMGPVGNVLASLSERKNYLVWLDFDRGLDEDMLQDLDTAVVRLKPGSILVVTAEADPKLAEDAGGIDKYVAGLRASFASLTEGEIQKADISKNDLPVLFARILRSSVSTSGLARPGISLVQLFNLVYADKSQMLTLAWVVADPAVQQKIEHSGVRDLAYTETGKRPKRITVPPLTARERHWIDARIDAGSRGIKAKKVPFEIEQESLNNYLEYYRHYPSYVESYL